MASYDPVTDRIYGCKKGSLNWWHEQGHRQWIKLGVESELDGAFNLFAIFVMGLTSFQVFILAQACTVIMLACYFLPEVHAWWFAFHRYGDKRALKEVLTGKKS